MKKPTFGQMLLAITAAGALVACSNSGKNDQQLDHERSMNQPRVLFVPAAGEPEVQMKSLDDNELQSLMRCEDPSSSIRLDKDQYSVSSTILERGVYGPDYPMAVMENSYTYKTENKGVLYTEAYSYPGTKIAGKSIEGDKAIAFIDTCTRDDNCDKEKRFFTAGDPVTYDKRTELYQREFERIQKEIIDAPGCKIESDEDGVTFDSTIQKGFVEIGGQVREAARIVKRSPKKYVCDGTKASTTGYRERVSVVLMDTIPTIWQMSDEVGCGRTKIFSSDVTVIDGKVHEAASKELIAFTINGEVQSLEDWKNSVKSYDQTTQDLENAVTAAESRFNDAKGAHSKAESAVSAAKSKHADYEANSINMKKKSEEVHADPESTEAQKAKALKDVVDYAELAAKYKVAYDDAVVAEEAARRAMNVAQDNLKAADVALKRHQENAPQPGV